MQRHGDAFRQYIFYSWFAISKWLWVIQQFASIKRFVSRFHNVQLVITLVKVHSGSLEFTAGCGGIFGGMKLPFDELVNLIYPTTGYVGILFLVFVISKDLRIALKRES